MYEDAPDAFDAIFRHVIALGKCIEVNTSGYATTGDTFAHSSLLRRYVELGGENFTFGSDSHDTARDYADVERAKEMCGRLGESIRSVLRGAGRYIGRYEVRGSRRLFRAKSGCKVGKLR